MKKRQVVLMLGLCWGLCFACSKDDDHSTPEPEPETGAVTASVTEVELLTAGDYKTFTVTAETKGWFMEVEGALEGITVSPQKGNAGTTEIGLTATQNNQEDARSGLLKIYLEDRKDSVQVAVRQEGVALTFNRRTDSLALVAIYNALGGANWTGAPQPPVVASLTSASEAALTTYPWDLSKPITEWGGVATEMIDGQLRVTGFSLEATAGVEGTFPAEVTRLRELKSLNFTDLSKVKGAFPADIYRLTKCESLKSNNMSLMDKWVVPERIVEMTALRSLTLRGLEFGLEGFSKLYVLTDLDSLTITDGSINGTLPEGISALKNLKYLNLNNCSQITGLSGDICDLPKLEYLSLVGCSRLTALPENFGNLKSLTYLSLTGSKRLTTLPASFSQLASLKELNIAMMKMTGDVDQLFSGLTKLEVLQADNNEFSGTLNWLKNLKSLRILVMSASTNPQHTLSGELKISELFTSEILQLMLDGHNITGTLEGIGNLRNLKILALNNCHLTGSLPAEMANLSLTSGSLDNNDLTGNIPVEMAGFLDHMAYPLILNGNRLGGNGVSLPAAVSDKWLKFHAAFCEQQEGYGFTDCDNLPDDGF